MARRGTKVLPARKPPVTREDDSLLIRSAESLGRVIGTLQRQMQGTGTRISRTAGDAIDALPEMPAMNDVLKQARQATGLQRAARTSSSGRKSAAARKATTTRKAAGSRSGSTRKSPAARKTSGREKQAARKSTARGRRKTSGR